MGPEPYDSDVLGTHIWGWMTEPELLWLGETATAMDSVVEVGSLHGRSAFMLLSSCAGTVYCVDSWSDEHDKSYPSFMRGCGHFPNLVPVRAFSPAAAELVPGEVDMTFLDGSHAYESVLADIAAWLPKTRKLICGHDYFDGPEAGFPGVAQAVLEVFGPERVTLAAETSIWAVDLTADRSVSKKLKDTTFDYIDEYGRPMHVEVNW